MRNLNVVNECLFCGNRIWCWIYMSVDISHFKLIKNIQFSLCFPTYYWCIGSEYISWLILYDFIVAPLVTSELYYNIYLYFIVKFLFLCATFHMNFLIYYIPKCKPSFANFSGAILYKSHLTTPMDIFFMILSCSLLVIDRMANLRTPKLV